MQKHPGTERNCKTRPFLKWAGGKQRLLSQLLPINGTGRRLIEPFVGAGAVFLGAEFDKFVLNDANGNLIALWAAVQERPLALIRAAAEFFQEGNRSVDAYYALRRRFNNSSDRLERAGLFLYLNRFGFNGLSRYNRDGNFNVPHGKPATVPSLPFERILGAA